MTDEIKVKVFRNGELIREVAAPNILVIAEFERGEMLSHFGAEEALMIMFQLSSEYDRLLKIIKDEFHLSATQVSELIKEIKVKVQVSDDD